MSDPVEEDHNDEVDVLLSVVVKMDNGRRNTRVRSDIVPRKEAIGGVNNEWKDHNCR